jgi:hypothetical protein
MKKCSYIVFDYKKLRQNSQKAEHGDKLLDSEVIVTTG